MRVYLSSPAPTIGFVVGARGGAQHVRLEGRHVERDTEELAERFARAVLRAGRVANARGPGKEARCGWHNGRLKRSHAPRAISNKGRGSGRRVRIVGKDSRSQREGWPRKPYQRRRRWASEAASTAARVPRPHSRRGSPAWGTAKMGGRTIKHHASALVPRPRLFDHTKGLRWSLAWFGRGSPPPPPPPPSDRGICVVRVHSIDDKGGPLRARWGGRPCLPAANSKRQSPRLLGVLPSSLPMGQKLQEASGPLLPQARLPSQAPEAPEAHPKATPCRAQ